MRPRVAPPSPQSPATPRSPRLPATPHNPRPRATPRTSRPPATPRSPRPRATPRTSRPPATPRNSRPPAPTLADLQQRVDAWIGQFEAGYWPPLSMLARLTEEVGELAREINHLYGHKPKRREEPPGDLALEVADVIFVLVCLCNSLGIDLGDAFERVMEKYDTRDARCWSRLERGSPRSLARRAKVHARPATAPRRRRKAAPGPARQRTPGRSRPRSSGRPRPTS